MDDARQGLCLDPLQRARRDQRRQCQRAASPLDLLHRRAGRPPGAAAGGRRTRCMWSPLAQRALRLRPHQGGLSAPVEVPPGREPERDRGVLLRRRSTGARSTPTARSSTTCSTGTRWRWTRSRARRCGRPQIADIAEGETTPMAPFVVKDRVIVGAVRRRVRHLRVAQGARPQDRQDRLDRAQHRPGCRHARQARHLQAVLRQGHRSRDVRAGRRTRGRSAAHRSGAGCPTTRSSTWCTTASGNPSPYNPEQRVGDNKWTDERARAPARGRIAGVGVSVHPARQLGLRRRRRP